MARTLDPAAVYALARAVGLSPDRAELFTAIAGAESAGFDAQAHNDSGEDDSYGLWQINMYGSLGPARRATYKLTSNADLYDPYVNAQVMAALSGKGGNTQPWSVVRNGRYRNYLPAAADARRRAEAAFRDAGDVGDDRRKWLVVASAHPEFGYGRGSGGPGVGDVPGIAGGIANDPVGTIGGAIGGIGGALPVNPLDVVADLVRTIMDPSWWRRLGIGVLGFALIIIALVVIFRKPITETATKAADVVV